MNLTEIKNLISLEETNLKIKSNIKSTFIGQINLRWWNACESKLKY